MPFPPGPRFWEGNTRVPGFLKGWGPNGGERHNYPLIPRQPTWPNGFVDFKYPQDLTRRLHRLAQFPVLHDAIPDLRPPGGPPSAGGKFVNTFRPNPPPTPGNTTGSAPRCDEAYYAHERGIDAVDVNPRPAAPGGGPGVECTNCQAGIGPWPFLTCRIFPTRPTLNGGNNELNNACTKCFYKGHAVPGNPRTCSIALTRKLLQSLKYSSSVVYD